MCLLSLPNLKVQIVNRLWIELLPNLEASYVEFCHMLGGYNCEFMFFMF